MAINVPCAKCGQTHAAPGLDVGERFRCRSCGHVQAVIGGAATAVELEVYDMAPGPEPRTLSPRRAARLPAGDARPTTRGGPHFAIFEESRVQGFAVALLALSAADLFMTYLLLRESPRFFEANPVARWFFDRWNMAGMTLFKFGVIGGVIAISEFVERRRPGWGRFVLGVGCLGAAYAVYRGYTLYAAQDAGAGPDFD